MDEQQMMPGPEDWTAEQVAEFRQQWDEAAGSGKLAHGARWPPPAASVTDGRQAVVLQLTWTEDGQEQQELFGPFIQGDPETEDGGMAHMVAAHRFLGEWRRATGREPLFADDATVILVNDPDEWLQQRKGSDGDQRG